MLQDHLDAGTSYNEEGLPQTHGREAFRANDFYSALGDWELQFVSTPDKVRTPITQGDEVETATRLYKSMSVSPPNIIKTKSRQMKSMKAISLKTWVNNLLKRSYYDNKTTSDCRFMLCYSQSDSPDWQDKTVGDGSVLHLSAIRDSGIRQSSHRRTFTGCRYAFADGVGVQANSKIKISLQGKSTLSHARSVSTTSRLITRTAILPRFL